MKEGVIRYGIGRGKSQFDVPFTIPAALCSQKADRQLVSDFLEKLLEEKDKEIMAQGSYGCIYCGNDAKTLYSLPVITLHAEPPTVLVFAQPLCSMSSHCARQAYDLTQSGIRDGPPFQTGGTQVYNKWVSTIFYAEHSIYVRKTGAQRILVGRNPRNFPTPFLNYRRPDPSIHLLLVHYYLPTYKLVNVCTNFQPQYYFGY
jgi:hypothetical protein